MNVCHTLIGFFFLSLHDGNTGLVNAQITVYERTEGGDVTIRCSFSFYGTWMLFCREPCYAQNILISTNEVRAEKGRYRIDNNGDVFVTIKQLTKADSGSYRCGLHQFGYSYQQIRIIVVDAILDGNPPGKKTLYTRSGGNILVRCYFTQITDRKYFCKDECKTENILVETSDNRVQIGRYSIEYISRGFLYVGITQLNKSDSGQYRCCMGRVLSPREFEIVVTDDSTTSTPNTTTSTSVPSATSSTQSLSSDSELAETTPSTGTGIWLYVGLTLAVMVVLLSLAVLIYCRKRSSQPKGPPMETEYASVTETNRVHEDIREDRQSRSSPVEISSVYSHAKYTKSDGAVTAARSQNTAEDDPSQLTYSELNFSTRTDGSSRDAVHLNSDSVVYSVPRAQMSSDSGPAEDETPVYSTVNHLK